ncbi:MAG: hypothetical protein AAB535_00945 [Patescibacteria group bacterium]
MRKEVVWAIIAGVLFGLVIAFGVVRVNSTLKPSGQKQEASAVPQSIINEFKITLSKPENEDVITQDFVLISGITSPKVQVIISAEDADYIVLTDQKGLFEKEIKLISGLNQIKITAVDPTGSQSVEKVLVVYSSAFEEKEGDRLEKAANKPKAYLGIVTDITDSTIQIKTTSGEIRQISITSDVTFVKIEPAIGDFIVAMGYRNGNQVLNAQRILITPAPVEPKITVTMGKGADTIPVKTTKIYPKKSDLTDESQVIYVTVEVKDKPTPRTIFVIQS